MADSSKVNAPVTAWLAPVLLAQLLQGLMLLARLLQVPGRQPLGSPGRRKR